ncbi:MAG: DUF4335 domain-containing protein [Symploca sp. SIO3E6]|nr:DUF4335 domain-containing protein [Caldora sp. SIO3E6]
MTIRRQYSLPNCTLILEGLSDPNATPSGQLDPRPLMTILVNAQCHFPGQDYLLEGGRDFFESLVSAVSRHAQESLSQVSHPKLDGAQPAMVQLEKVEDKNLHQLTQLAAAEKEQGQSLQIDLTTVQLFDLVEAIDQFLADGRTLPDINVGIEPVSKRYRKAEIPMTQRAAPAAVGMTSLVLAAVALFFVPVPELSETQLTITEETPSEEEQATEPSPTPTRSPTTELEAALQSEITDPTEVRFLQRSLYKKVNQAWQDWGEAYQTLSYRVSVGRDGEIIGYKPINNTDVDADEDTPLPELLYTPTEDNQEAIASFRVVFNRTGVLQVSPWLGYQGEPGFGPEMTDSELISDLNEELRETLSDRWEGSEMTREKLAYRVGVTEEGIIADYEPTNQSGWDYVEETPLEELLNPEAAGIGSEGLVPKEPLAQFRVVLWPNGSLEVDPLP